MVQRYRPDELEMIGMHPESDGDYVDYADYTALERERDELLQKVQVLEKENALLRKRLEPIDVAHMKYKDYPLSAISKRNAYSRAINQCMELEEGK